jgi:hypothetical protein
MRRNNSPSSTYYKRNIIVDFNKLSKNNLFNQNVNEISLENLIGEELAKITDPNILNRLDNADMNVVIPQTNNNILNIEDLEKILKENKNKKQTKKQIKKFQKEEKFKENDDDNDYDEEIKKCNFRLETFDNSIIKTKDMYIVDFVKEKLYGYSSIKDLQDEAHKIIHEINESRLKENTEMAKKDTFLTMDQRFFKKIYGNMNFSNLKAVDEAYHERDVSDRIILKQKKVENLKEMKKISSQQIDYFRDDHIKLNQKMAQQNSNLLQLARIKESRDYEKLKDHVTFLREKNKKVNQERRKDVMLAINFSKQHLSVSKALQKHEFLLFKENQQKTNSNFVTQQYNRQMKQHEMVKKFIEQRKILRTVQANADRELIATRIKNDKEFVEADSKKRVEYLKELDYYNKHELNRNFSLPAIDMTNQFQPEVENDQNFLNK